ncbi:MAG: RNA polymerase sigma factor [Amphiplicatus sp.]
MLVRALVRLSVQPADVDDILQESLARALEADGKNPLEFPKSYLFTVSRNIVFEQQERRSREVQWEIDEAILESKTAPTDDEIHYRRMMEVFWEAMATLPKAHQQAILLRRIYGLSHKDIANKMNVSISSVEKYFAQGIKRCQDIMARRGYGIAEGKGVEPRYSNTDGKGRSHD